MIEKTITYENLRGNQVTGTFAFNLRGSEVAELAMTRQGLDEYLRSIVKTENVKELFVIFKELLSMAVGRIVNDEVFDKSPEITAAFMHSGAYEEFFFELIGNPTYAAEFIAGIMPPNLEARIDKIMKGDEEKVYTDADLMSMSQDEFDRVVGKDQKKWDQRTLQIAYRRATTAA